MYILYLYNGATATQVNILSKKPARNTQSPCHLETEETFVEHLALLLEN